MHVSSRQVGWDVFFPAVVYAYNTSISETTGDILSFSNVWKRASTYDKYNYAITCELIIKHRFPSSMNDISNSVDQRNGIVNTMPMNLVESDNSNKIPKFPDNTPNGRESLN